MQSKRRNREANPPFTFEWAYGIVEMFNLFRFNLKDPVFYNFN